MNDRSDDEKEPVKASFVAHYPGIKFF